MKSLFICMMSSLLLFSLLSCGQVPVPTEAEPALNDNHSAEASDSLPTPFPPPPTIDPNQPTPTAEIHPNLDEEVTIDASLVVRQETTPFKVEITTQDQITLVGTYYPPKEADAPTLLLLHMLGGERRVWRNFGLDAQQDGFAALAIDLRGHGESGGEGDLAAMESDIESALTWLTQQEKVGEERIAIIGASASANLALRVGAKQAQVNAIGLLSPVSERYAPSIADTSTANKAIFVAASDNDRYSLDTTNSLQERSSTTTVVTYPGDAHGTNLLLSNNEIIQSLLNWLSGTL